MTTSPRWIFLGLFFSAAIGCFNDCDACGRCSSGSAESAAPALQGPRVEVWLEPSGEVVLQVLVDQFSGCTTRVSEQLFFRWDPNTNRLETRTAGASSRAARQAGVTLGGGVTSYTNLAPGLSLQISGSGFQQRAEITASYRPSGAPGTSQVITCTASFSMPLQCL